MFRTASLREDPLDLFGTQKNRELDRLAGPRNLEGRPITLQGRVIEEPEAVHDNVERAPGAVSIAQQMSYVRLHLLILRSGRALDGNAAPVLRPPTSTSRGSDPPSPARPWPHPCDDAIPSWSHLADANVFSDVLSAHCGCSVVEVKRSERSGSYHRGTSNEGIRDGIFPAAFSGLVQRVLE